MTLEIRAELQRTETILEAANRLSEIVKKHFPLPENFSDVSFFKNVAEEGQEETRRWKLNVDANGNFSIEDILPITNSLHAGGFTQRYIVNPNSKGSDSAIIHRNDRLPRDKSEKEDIIADTEKALKMFLPEDFNF